MRIQCVCTGTNGNQRVRWFDINGNYLSDNQNGGADSPYSLLTSATDVTLIIPTFTDSYYGTYNCGIYVSDTEFTSPSAAVTLTIGELMINIVSYLYVAT